MKSEASRFLFSVRSDLGLHLTRRTDALTWVGLVLVRSWEYVATLENPQLFGSHECRDGYLVAKILDRAPVCSSPLPVFPPHDVNLTPHGLGPHVGPSLRAKQHLYAHRAGEAGSLEDVLACWSARYLYGEIFNVSQLHGTPARAFPRRSLGEEVCFGPWPTTSIRVPARW